MEFNALDYSIIALYISGIVALGAYFTRRQKSLKEYFHAGGNIPWWAAGISMMATKLSPITYLALPGWIFIKDSRTSIVVVLIGLALVPLTAVIWLPLWSRLRVTSIYEYLELRFHPSIRTFGAVLFLLLQICWVGMALVTAALGFELVTGFDGRWCLVLITVVGTAYTVMGGMRAVIWTDVAQFAVFVLGYGAILIVLLQLFDWRPMEIYRIASTTISAETGYPHTKLVSFELSLAVEATFWVILFGRILGAFAAGSEQLYVQRLHATRSRREMYKAMYGEFFFTFLFLLIVVPAAWGFVAFYAQDAELKSAIVHPDQVLPDFVIRNLPVVFRSLIMAGVLAALMSSLDSSLNSTSNIVISDFYRKYLVPHATDEQLVRAARLMTVMIGTVVLAFSLWQFDHRGATAIEKFGKLANLINAPVPAFFLLGIFSKRVNTPGAVIGAVAAIGFAVVFNGVPGIMDEPLLDWINWMWVSGLAMLINMAVGYAASFLFPPPSGAKLEQIHS